MNILLAFKAEPDAGMLAEKEWQAAAQGNSGPDVSLLRSLLGADEQAAAALLLAQRKNGTPMSLTALSMGDERALPVRKRKNVIRRLMLPVFMCRNPWHESNCRGDGRYRVYR